MAPFKRVGFYTLASLFVHNYIMLKLIYLSKSNYRLPLAKFGNRSLNFKIVCLTVKLKLSF